MKTNAQPARLDEHDAEILAKAKREQEERAARYLSRCTPNAAEERTPYEQRAADLGVGEVVLAWCVIGLGTAFVAAVVYLIFETLFRD